MVESVEAAEGLRVLFFERKSDVKHGMQSSNYISKENERKGDTFLPQASKQCAVRLVEDLLAYTTVLTSPKKPIITRQS
jgi:hypothetical protein